MSAPPLPEAFGNYALGEFVEVVSPADISWLPQTAGWTWVGIALLLFAGHRGWRAAGRGRAGSTLGRHRSHKDHGSNARYRLHGQRLGLPPSPGQIGDHDS